MTTHRRHGTAQHAFQAMPTALGQVYVGLPYTITVDVDMADGPPLRLRVHDGHTPGGAVTNLVPSAGVSGALPPAVVVPEVSLTLTDGVPMNYHHGLGYKPLVQVLDAGGEVGGVQIVHHDDENFSVVASVAGDYTILVR